MSPSNQVWIVANRRARHLTHEGPLLAALRASAGPNVIVVETSSRDELDRAVDALAIADARAVLLAGGDGSHMEGVSALVRRYGDRPLPRVGLAPGGTVSTVLHNWRRSKARAVSYLHELVREATRPSPTTVLRPTLQVGQRVGFIFGTGLVARFFEAYDAAGAGGRLPAAKLVARIFVESFVGGAFARSVLSPMPCTVAVDGQDAPFSAVSLLCASVVPNLGLGMRLLPRAGERRDRFHVVATPLGPARLGPQMPLVLAGKPLLGPKIDALAASISLRFAEGRGAYVLDGELLRADVITVAAGPSIDVLTP